MFKLNDHKTSRMNLNLAGLLLQTDEIEHETHEHSITSKINLVDLAGSERQSQAKTSGDRLRVRFSTILHEHIFEKIAVEIVPHRGRVFLMWHSPCVGNICIYFQISYIVTLASKICSLVYFIDIHKV